MKFLVASVCAVALMGCVKNLGPYVSVEEFADVAPPDAEYIIRAGDVLNVRVFQQDNMSARVRVRTDGKISLPFLNDVGAAGYTPVVLSAQLQTRLKDFINNPVVTISLEEVRQVPVSVLGEVQRPGIYTLETGAGVLQALASAGGFSTFADKDVFVIRSSGAGEAPKRVRFSYEALTRAEGKGPLFRLKPQDVVVVY